MSPGQISDFTFSFWKMIPNFKVLVLDTKMKSSMMYWFYHENFDFEKKSWKISRDYMINDPINRTLENKST